MTDNADLAAALRGYALRSGPDDFSSMTGFLEQHPGSVWCVAVLTGLGLEYYHTAHYSLALEAWQEAWAKGQNAATAQGKLLADRAGGELAYMYARLGRMNELEAFLQSSAARTFTGPASQRVIRAREGLWTMKNRPQVAFRCGPLALYRIKLSLDRTDPAMELIRNAASTQQGFSLPQVTELSRKIGLNYQMAFREKDGAFIVPSVVHWKVGHYAALTRQDGDRYLLEDPTFGNRVWATRKALEDETSGYFLIGSGPLPKHWRPVTAIEGQTIWGKGYTGLGDPGALTPKDMKTGPVGCQAMIVPQVHLLTANLSLADEPVGYTPPVGPRVFFTVRYNSLDGFQPANEAFSNFGPQWSSDWISYITDDPTNHQADVYYFIGGGQRTFTFDTNTQSYAYQQYDQTLLTRTGPASYTMTWPDNSRMVFSQSDGSFGSTRRIFLTQMVDAQGNGVTLTYDGLLRLVAITDAIGQVTTISHGLPGTNLISLDACTGNTNYLIAADAYKITKVTDPFGRAATFDYRPGLIGFNTCYDTNNQAHTNLIYTYLLKGITDVIGMTSQVTYTSSTNVSAFSTTSNGLFFVTNYSSIAALTTPYGTTHFFLGYANNATNRVAELTYPDGSRERIEYDEVSSYPEYATGLPLPQGMNPASQALVERNTFYWSRNACATSYGDYTKARLVHWVAQDFNTTLDIPLSAKEPLENRVWYDYGGQSGEVAGTNNLPTHMGRVLDDGSTQLYTYSYNTLGRVTSTVDPMGRTFSYTYATNGIDLVEVRMTRAGKNELLFQATYNSQHEPLTTTDAAGQTTRYSYNARGQVLGVTNARNETLTFDYDSNAYLLAIHGPLAGPNDTATATYDAFGRTRTVTDVSGYTMTFDYDSLDRLTQITYPDATFEKITYNRLDPVVFRDRAGRLTILNYDNLRHLTQITDALGRATRLGWCSCGALNSLTDPMGRTTSWLTDVQGRKTAKRYADGSQISYLYENTTSRMHAVIDENQQMTLYAYNLDDSFRSLTYGNTIVPTPTVIFTYDPDYRRVSSVTDGAGTTLYSYNSISASPILGAGQLASVTGPLPNETVTYSYDELGRVVHRAINGVDSAVAYDAAGRMVIASNILGSFNFTYDGGSRRLLSAIFPNGQTTRQSYGSISQDLALQRITHQAGASLLSEFVYGVDVPSHRITNWSQQTGTSTSLYTFSYDIANQLLLATVTNAGALANTFAYSYDPAANRLGEETGGTNYPTTYNALNQISTTTAQGASRTNEWDGANRLAAVNRGNKRTEFDYDGASRMVGIRQLVNGAAVSHRKLAWHGGRIVEERDTNGVVTKRFFPQGVQLVTGTNAGFYYYTRDHLGSIREVTDAAGNIRARYAYDPFGRRTKVTGDLDADFGFAGMFWGSEADLYLTHFRQYDPDLGRWLSRDPLANAELRTGPNLYAYVRNNPISRIDPHGLIDSGKVGLMSACARSPSACMLMAEAVTGTVTAVATHPEIVEEGAAAVEAGLPALEAEAPTLLECAPRVAQVVQQFGGKVGDLTGATLDFQTISTEIQEADIALEQSIAERVANLRDLLPTLTEDLQILQEEGFETDPLYEAGSQFFEIATDLARTFHIAFPRAQSLLSESLGGWLPP